MEKVVDFKHKQHMPVTQFNDMQEYMQAANDHVVADCITDEFKYTGFDAVKTSDTECTLAGGRLYKNGQVFASEGEAIQPLLPYLPNATQKIIAIAANTVVVDGKVQTYKQLVDPETRETMAVTGATEKHRNGVLNIIQGLEAAAPQKPSVETNLLVICWVWLDNASIIKIEMNDANRLPSVKQNAEGLKALENWRDATGQRMDTLASDMTGLAVDLSQKGDGALLQQMAGDIARLKEANELEDDAFLYGADRYMDDAESDILKPGYLAKVEEGVRPSADNADISALTLTNIYNSNVSLVNGFLLPAFDEVRRIALEQNDDQLPISQYTFQTVDWVQKSMARQRIKYGETTTICTNNSWWKSGHYDPISKIFYKDGETWEVEKVTPHYGQYTANRLRKYWVDTVIEPYMDRLVTNHSVQGSMVANTFLNSQDTWMTSLDLLFTQVAATGDVTVLIAEATKAGKPNLDAVIQSVTLPHGDIVQGPETWTNIQIPPTFLKQGNRYAICLITGGDHYVALTTGSNYAEGTLFQSTDGAFFQGDLTKDICFRINAARFKAARIEVGLDPINLNGGIAEIDILTDAIIPAGTVLQYEIQHSGGQWLTLDEVKEGNSALHGLPALCNLRAVFLGTKDVMPGVNLGTSRVMAERPRTNFKHFSKSITLPSATQSLTVTVLLESFLEANHDLDVTINDITNGNDNVAAAVVTDVDRGAYDKSGSGHRNISRTFEWTATELPVGTTEFAIIIDGTTVSALDTFHVAERFHLAF